MIEKTKSIFLKYRETIMYLIVGGSTTVVNWVSYALLLRAFSNSNHSVFLANTFAWVISMIFAYVANKILVFESYNWEIKYVVKEASLFVSARVVTGLLEIFGIPFLVEDLGFDAEILGVRGMFAKVVISVVVIVLNYVLSKLFVFRNGKEDTTGGIDND